MWLLLLHPQRFREGQPYLETALLKWPNDCVLKHNLALLVEKAILSEMHVPANITVSGFTQISTPGANSGLIFARVLIDTLAVSQPLRTCKNVCFDVHISLCMDLNLRCRQTDVRHLIICHMPV